MTSYNGRPAGKESTTDGTNEKTINVGIGCLPISSLYPFRNHPFKIYTEEKMQELVISVSEYNILTPILVRPIKNKKEFEIISGHNRVEAAKRAGLTIIPATIREMDDDEAVIFMVDSSQYHLNFIL
jgi:ParB family chromosome partitioning protein